MDKTVAALMVAMVASVMAIPLAYMAGKGNAEKTLSAAVEEELVRSRAERDGEIAALRKDLAEASLEQARAVNDTQKALWKAGINFNEDSPVEEPSGGEADQAAALVTFEVFDSMAEGTSYDDVVKAFGGEGTMKLSMEDGAGSVTQQFVWEWTAADGTPGKADLFFLDGKLQSKSYKG